MRLFAIAIILFLAVQAPNTFAQGGADATPGITQITGDATAGPGSGSTVITVSKIGGKGVTLGGALTTIGPYTLTETLTGNTSLTLPTSGTLLTTAGSGASLTGLTWSQIGSTPTTLAGYGITSPLTIAQGGTNCATASITCFNNVTGYAAAGTTGTTSANLVFSTSPALVTPSLGVATLTSAAINGCTISGLDLCTNGSVSFGMGSTHYITISGAASEPTIGTNGGSDLTVSSGLHVGGSLQVNAASVFGMDYSSGTGRLFAYGPNSGTVGKVAINVLSSTGSGQLTLFSSDTSGNITLGTSGALDNVPSLSASSAVYTDVFKNLTSTAPTGYGPVLTGTTTSIGGSALLAGACSTGTVTINGVATNMVFSASPATAAGSLTVKASSINAYYSAADTVEVDVCMSVAGTPTASNYNVRVLQ